MSDFPQQGQFQSNRSFLRTIRRWRQDDVRRSIHGSNRWEQDALEIAKCRYAAGKISREEFLSIKASCT